jgi:hypothetical protein
MVFALEIHLVFRLLHSFESLLSSAFRRAALADISGKLALALHKNEGRPCERPSWVNRLNAPPSNYEVIAAAW